MTLGEKITGLRKKRGLSQEELAITLGVSRQAVSKWELGDATPDTDKVVALAEYFGVTTDWLLRDIEPAAAPHPADTIPSAAAMLRDTPMLFNLTIGGNIFGAALMLYDLWQQTYYHIPTLLGMIVQIGMCALFLGLCHSIRAQDDAAGRAWARAYWRCNIFALALLPSFWAAETALHLFAQFAPVSTLFVLPLTAVLYLLACLPIAFVGLWSAIRQAKAAVSCIGLIAKRPDQLGKAIILPAMVETYAILALLVSILAVFGITPLAL